MSTWKKNVQKHNWGNAFYLESIKESPIINPIGAFVSAWFGFHRYRLKVNHSVSNDEWVKWSGVPTMIMPVDWCLVERRINNLSSNPILCFATPVRENNSELRFDTPIINPQIIFNWKISLLLSLSVGLCLSVCLCLSHSLFFSDSLACSIQSMFEVHYGNRAQINTAKNF